MCYSSCPYESKAGPTKGVCAISLNHYPYDAHCIDDDDDERGEPLGDLIDQAEYLMEDR